MKKLLENNPFILMEAAIVEQLRRSGEVHLHETLVNAPLIYDPEARDVMGAIYLEYMRLAENAQLPILVCTPTWRANRARVRDADISDTVNPDAVSFLRELRDSAGYDDTRVKIGGMIGCRNDCYRPDEGLSAAEAEQFHAWQVQQLASAGVDFLLAETLPNVQEALGIAKAMEATGVPYMISFVISRDGHVLDGSSLEAAIELIDAGTSRPPLGYMVNCAHPSFLCPEQQPRTVFNRLIGYQANASSLDHCDLDNAGELKADDVAEWGQLMLTLNQSYGVKILGGCCGTGIEHLQYLVTHRKH
ncbi:homocysteine S-methyltransferase family protein [Marinobacter koreensis]|uniref:Homocysteine S-methyltransferase family protein n=1 Tax=Marinobacter koreensis TaxID=335974 RepID=A0ABW0RLT2_9GAMM|nr:homocysteine S-methyltransferase family protein [Marinobacter koreensis]MCK7547888.1 homocysteine S-methyltransferase family protein [Marinobacter koreensis]